MIPHASSYAACEVLRPRSEPEQRSLASQRSPARNKPRDLSPIQPELAPSAHFSSSAASAASASVFACAIAARSHFPVGARHSRARAQRKASTFFAMDPKAPASTRASRIFSQAAAASSAHNSSTTRACSRGASPAHALPANARAVAALPPLPPAAAASFWLLFNSSAFVSATCSTAAPTAPSESPPSSSVRWRREPSGSACARTAAAAPSTPALASTHLR
mmetsp:Transcript_1767/g.4436  ORF Transcript_1767/g.4436 Transcript_1767/m.4436 type:complete len:221 (+) Transcript_1767:148-810(+)